MGRPIKNQELPCKITYSDEHGIIRTKINPAWQREHRRKLAIRGICTICKHKPLTEGMLSCESCREKAIIKRQKYKESGDRNKYNREYKQKIRKEVIAHYGGKCVCCGESEYCFLDLDHINGGGDQDRIKAGLPGGTSFALWLRKNNYPDYIQILCANCNQGKHRNRGICPHKKEEIAPQEMI